MFEANSLVRQVQAQLSRQGRFGRSLIKTAAGTAGIRVAYAGIGLVISILMARLLGPSSYGIYAFAMALTQFLTIPSELGVPALATREIAIANARKDWSRMGGFIRWAHQTVAIIALLIGGVAAATLYFFWDRIGSEKATCVALGVVLVPVMSFGALRGAILRGLRLVILGQLPERIIKPAVVAAILIAIAFGGRGRLSPVDAMTIQIVAAAVAFGCGTYFLVRSRPAELSQVRATTQSSGWLISTIPFAMTAALQLINGKTDILALGSFHDPAEVGVYRVAVQLAALVIFGLQVVNVIQGPHIAHMYAARDMRRLQTMVTKSSRGILALTVPAIVFLVIFGKPVIRLAFGTEYEGAYLPLMILCVGQLVNASMGSVSSLLNMTGNERDTFKSLVVGATVNIVLNLTLTPVWGMIGAALATTSTLIVWNLLMWRAVRARTGIEASPFYRPK